MKILLRAGRLAGIAPHGKRAAAAPAHEKGRTGGGAALILA
jgi:hypothetical protein